MKPTMNENGLGSNPTGIFSEVNGIETTSIQVSFSISSSLTAVHATIVPFKHYCPVLRSNY